jgi:transposase-like protein
MNNYTAILKTNINNLRSSFSMLSLDKFVITTIETLMQIERSEYLTTLTDKQGDYDKANGYYSRLFRSLQNSSLMINIPRVRSSQFSPLALELIKLNKDQVNHLALSLYKKGMTTRDIESLLKNCFAESLSHTSINKLAKEFSLLRKAWEDQKLDKHYKVIYCDVVFITVRRGDSYSKEGVYISYGVKQNNKRELLSLDINPTESALVWGEQFERLKEKGVEQVDLIVSDELTGMKTQVNKHFPQANYQICLVHKHRSVLRKVRTKDKKQVVTDLKQVFNNFSETSSLKKAKEKLKRFLTKWQKLYPKLKRQFPDEKIQNYFAYIKFNPEVRRLIYTTNSIENLNRAIRKATKNKLSFESPEYLLDYVFMVIKDFEDKNWVKYPVSQFNNFRKLKNEESSQTQST